MLLRWTISSPNKSSSLNMRLVLRGQYRTMISFLLSTMKLLIAFFKMRLRIGWVLALDRRMLVKIRRRMMMLKHFIRGLVERIGRMIIFKHRLRFVLNRLMRHLILWMIGVYIWLIAWTFSWISNWWFLLLVVIVPIK